ncbi:MAG: T9SS type A sorting domain-containing protein [bacterium]
MKQRLKILFLLFFFLGFYQIQAQRPPCYPDYISLSYAGKIPSRFPLLKLDMPYETMLNYIWWNDWCHNYEDLETGKYFGKKNFDDEYKEIIKRLYITQDYNPVLFVEHLYYDDTLMKTCPYCLDYYLIDRFYRIAPELKIHYALIESDIIVRIKTTGIIERDYFGTEGYIITSEVQDVIKGKVIPTCKDVSIPETPDEYVRPAPCFQINEPGKCFQFVFDHKFSEDVYEFGNIGNEYIVFIDLMPFYAEARGSLCTDSLNNCYYISKITEDPYYYLFYIFPIKNDKVFDYCSPLHFGDSLTYSEWRQKLQEKIDEILNKNYTSVDDDLPNTNDVFSVYPNPADDFIEISFGSLNRRVNPTVNELYDIRIYNLLGLSVFNLTPIVGANGLLPVHVDVSKFPAGIYFVVVESAGIRKACPVIIR